jgi:6-phosphogluconolactonase
MTDIRLVIAADADTVATRLADFLLEAARAKEGHFAVALSGGSTPRRLYGRLAKPPYLEAFPWSRVHWFWGDERFVPHEDSASNYKMVYEAMLAHAPAPPQNVHPVPTEGMDAAAAALAYAQELQNFYGAPRLDSARPLFDVNLLGLGGDGHTASLFPGTAALDEREQWAVAVAGAQAQTRITLTYPVLESSRDVIFMVTGAEKHEMLVRLRRGDTQIPAGRVRPIGNLWLFTDAAAAGTAVA